MWIDASRYLEPPKKPVSYPKQLAGNHCVTPRLNSWVGISTTAVCLWCSWPCWVHRWLGSCSKSGANCIKSQIIKRNITLYETSSNITVAHRGGTKSETNADNAFYTSILVNTANQVSSLLPIFLCSSASMTLSQVLRFQKLAMLVLELVEFNNEWQCQFPF